MRLQEKTIQSNIMCFLEECGAYVKKINSVGIYDPRAKSFRKDFSRFNQRGMPDILCIFEGKVYFIEVKTPIGKLRDTQREVIRELQAHNQVAFVSRSVSQTFEQLKPFLSNWHAYEHIAQKWVKIECTLQADH